MIAEPIVRIAALSDPADAMFDERETPFLTFDRHPQHGLGWTLWYLDETGAVEDHFIPGDITDGGWALSQAREWLCWRFTPEAES